MSDATRAVSGAPRTRLSRYLLRITAATLLPLIVFALLAGWLLARNERATFERGAQERVRALSTAVDAELRGSLTTLQALAQSNALRADDLAAFHALALRVKEDNPNWITIILARPDTAQQLVNVVRPYGAELPRIHERASFDAVIATRRPVVGDLVYGTLSKTINAGLRVPVLVNGELRYVLSAVIDPAAIQHLLAEQRFPADWVGVVLDRQHMVVARTVMPEATVGQPASQSLRDALARSREGFFQGSTIEGAEVYTPFFTSPFSGWSVAMGIPAAAVVAAGQRSMWTLLGGAALALLAGFAVAQWLGRRLAAPIAALAGQARALGAGEPYERDAVRQAPVVEIEHLAAAIDQAAAAVQARDATQRELAAVTDNATLALFMLDERHHCTYLNPAAEAMSGYTLADLHSRRAHDLLQRPRPDGAPYPFEQSPVARALHEDRVQRGEDVLLDKAGRFVPVAFTASPIRKDGRPAGTIVELRDISAEQRAEAERAELLARERAARAEAEAANRAKDEFLAMLGHELRNPLGAISNAAHVARRAPGSEHAERAQDVIARQLTHLTRLVDDLLDAGRVASGKIVLTRAPLDLAELVRRSAASLAAGGRSSGHDLRLDLEPVWVSGDETRLEQVVGNLLANALRYTPAGGRIDVRVATDGAQGVLSVADTGIGIPPELLPRLFSLFVQGSRSLERSQGGLGIGLTLVRRLAELHGGTAEAASAGAERGSTFTVRLPRIEAPASAPVPAASAPSAAGPAPRRRVLVVEDNDDVRAMLRSALQLAGHEVIERSDGPGGIDAALSLHPQVAVVDIGLPGISGYEVARRIRADGNGNGMLLIALTGYGQPDDRQRSIDSGFDLHATKPVDAARLMQTIAEWPVPAAPQPQEDGGRA